MLEIRLLGGYEVRLAGAWVEISSRPAKLLLTYLALSPGTPLPREKVAGILWPDSDEASARGNLRQALWRLRRAIGAEYLSTNNKSVALSTNSEYWIDTALLSDPSDHNLHDAVSAYKGELLPGFYEDWVLRERERLQAVFERKIQHLLDTLIQQQSWSDVRQWAEHWIALSQAPEPAYRALMIAHAAESDLTAVASAYERCLSALQLEIGVEPSAETQKLYRNLLGGQRPAVRSGTSPRVTELNPGPRHNLPQQSTSFIGRERELAQAQQLLANGRLLTIVGPGGMGKTRLALQLAWLKIDEFRHGVYFVSLAPIDSSGQLVQTIAEAIGFPLSTDEEPKHQLLRHFRNRQYLLLIDNFEHLLEGAGLIAEILRTSHDVIILVTSRERLNLQEESLLRIDGLAYPHTAKAPNILEYAAVRLFVDNARHLMPAFAPQKDNLADVGRICQMVQGMPLGILLAAAWVDMLTPAEIADEMNRSLDFLQIEWRDVPERHRSLRAAIESSWRWLTEGQRELLARLSVFRGGFTFSAAQMVTDASLPGLAGLVHKSLINRNLENGRYGIHELLRQFAAEKLEADSRTLQAVTKAHAVYFADYMEERWDHLTDSRQVAAMVEIEADLENIRRAWRYWLARQNAGRIRQFLDSFWRACEIRGWFNTAAALYTDAVDVLRLPIDQALDPDSTENHKVVYAHALAIQAFFMTQLGEVEKGKLAAQESITILQDAGRLDELALPLTSLRWIADYIGSRGENIDISWESVEIIRKRSSEWMQAYVLCWQGREAALNRDPKIGQQQVEESQRIFEARGDIVATVWPLIELGNMAIRRGAYHEARQQYERGLQACKKTDFQWGVVKSTRYLSIAMAMTGEYNAARGYLRQCLQLADELGLPHDVVNALFELATVEANPAGDEAMAVQLLTIVQDHPLSNQTRTMSLWTGDGLVHLRDLARERLAELESQLDPATYATAVRHGRTSTLDSVVSELLANP